MFCVETADLKILRALLNHKFYGSIGLLEIKEPPIDTLFTKLDARCPPLFVIYTCFSADNPQEKSSTHLQLPLAGLENRLKDYTLRSMHLQQALIRGKSGEHAIAPESSEPGTDLILRTARSDRHQLQATFQEHADLVQILIHACYADPTAFIRKDHRLGRTILPQETSRPPPSLIYQIGWDVEGEPYLEIPTLTETPHKE